jgi:hypothetical protein
MLPRLMRMRGDTKFSRLTSPASVSSSVIAGNRKGTAATRGYPAWLPECWDRYRRACGALVAGYLGCRQYPLHGVRIAIDQRKQYTI